MYLIDNNNSDPGFKFENLLRTIFDNCNKSGDPWGYASQDVYNNFLHKTNLRGKRALSTALCKLIYDNRTKPNIKEVINIEEKIWKAKTQSEIIEIIDNSINWIIKNCT